LPCGKVGGGHGPRGKKTTPARRHSRSLDPRKTGRRAPVRADAGATAAAGVPVVAIEHVGSTSVHGLSAKPIIDCDIVAAEQDVSAASETLIALGFKHLGELGIPMRWAFK
jgi:GrpB protein